MAIEDKKLEDKHPLKVKVDLIGKAKSKFMKIKEEMGTKTYAATIKRLIEEW